MTADPTPDDIARAKRWAAMQVPPVTVECSRHAADVWFVKNFPTSWMNGIDWIHDSNDAAWSAIAAIRAMK